MANVDKSSVRNEVSLLKADFEQLCADGKITSECKVLMNSMFMIIDLILSIFLEKVTKKNSNNSSIQTSPFPPKNSQYIGHFQLFHRRIAHFDNNDLARRCLGTKRRELTTKLFLSSTALGLLEGF